MLAILAIECGQVVATERLIELLWPDDGDKKVASVQAYISNLRKLVGGTLWLRTRPPAARVSVGHGASQIDVLRFEDHVVAGSPVRGVGRHRWRAGALRCVP